MEYFRLFITAVKSMTPLMENATSANVLKWLEVAVLTEVNSSPLCPTLLLFSLISHGLWEHPHSN